LTMKYPAPTRLPNIMTKTMMMTGFTAPDPALRA
jgi:hypothetical protein